jgi:uncharacterized protein YecE (DUF72 family)
VGRLKPHIGEALRFIEQMGGLGDRLGPLFVQLPPSYSPASLGDLEAFLTAMPLNAVELALEVRHLDWFREPHASRLTDILEQLQIGRVILDTRPIYEVPDDPQLHSERKKPRLPLTLSMTAPFSLIRYISHPDLAFNQPFMEAWVEQIDMWLRQGTRLYVFIHCPVEARSPTNAWHLQQLLEQAGAPVPPLPWNGLEAPAAQLSLFDF